MKMIRMREDVLPKMSAATCEIQGARGLKLIDLTDQQITLLQTLWRDGLQLASLKNLEPSERALIQRLSDAKVLRQFEPDYTRDEIWLSHYVSDARAALAELSKKLVLIVGCGGTGAIVADHLARAGVRRFVLVDGAKLDLPDLNRQWTYAAGGEGQAKVALLEQHLRALGATEVETLEKELTSSDDLAPLKSAASDLIVWCADKPAVTIDLLGLELAEAADRPVLFGAVGIDDDRVGPLVTTQEQREVERARLNRIVSSGNLAPVIKGSLSFTNSVAAGRIGYLAYRNLIGF